MRIGIICFFVSTLSLCGSVRARADDKPKPQEARLVGEYKVPPTAALYKMESTSLYFAAAFLDKGIWKEDGDEFALFTLYDPKAAVRVAPYDRVKKDFNLEAVTEISGAEYRRAVATLKAFASYSKLDAEAQRRIDLELFGQETRPAKGTGKHSAGVEKIGKAVEIINGEIVARPAKP